MSWKLNCPCLRVSKFLSFSVLTATRYITNSEERRDKTNTALNLSLYIYNIMMKYANRLFDKFSAMTTL